MIVGLPLEGKTTLLKLTADSVPAVRVAAAQALCKFGDLSQMKLLVEHIKDPNLLVGMFALRAIEELGDAGKAHREAIASAQKSPAIKKEPRTSPTTVQSRESAPCGASHPAPCVAQW